jgi:hypothetical protein
MQTTFMTHQCLRLAMRKSAALIRNKSVLRVAAFAQPVPFQGRWNPVRFNWSDEPERIADFSPAKGPSCTAPVTSVYEVFCNDSKIGISVALSQSQALANAIKATTRNTASKLDSDACDFDGLTVSLLAL